MKKLEVLLVGALGLASPLYADNGTSISSFLKNMVFKSDTDTKSERDKIDELLSKLPKSESNTHHQGNSALDSAFGSDLKSKTNNGIDIRVIQPENSVDSDSYMVVLRSLDGRKLTNVTINTDPDAADGIRVYSRIDNKWDHLRDAKSSLAPKPYLLQRKTLMQGYAEQVTDRMINTADSTLLTDAVSFAKAETESESLAKIDMLNAAMEAEGVSTSRETAGLRLTVPQDVVTILVPKSKANAFALSYTHMSDLRNQADTGFAVINEKGNVSEYEVPLKNWTEHTFKNLTQAKYDEYLGKRKSFVLKKAITTLNTTKDSLESMMSRFDRSQLKIKEFGSKDSFRFVDVSLDKNSLIPTHGNFAGPGYSAGERKDLSYEETEAGDVYQVKDPNTGLLRDDYIDAASKRHDLAYILAEGKPDYWKRIEIADTQLIEQVSHLIMSRSLDGKHTLTMGERLYAHTLINAFLGKAAMMQSGTLAIERLQAEGRSLTQINDALTYSGFQSVFEKSQSYKMIANDLLKNIVTQGSSLNPTAQMYLSEGTALAKALASGEPKQKVFPINFNHVLPEFDEGILTKIYDTRKNEVEKIIAKQAKQSKLDVLDQLITHLENDKNMQFSKTIEAELKKAVADGYDPEQMVKMKIDYAKEHHDKISDLPVQTDALKHTKYSKKAIKECWREVIAKMQSKDINVFTEAQNSYYISLKELHADIGKNPKKDVDYWQILNLLDFHPNFWNIMPDYRWCLSGTQSARPSENGGYLSEGDKYFVIFNADASKHYFVKNGNLKWELMKDVNQRIARQNKIQEQENQKILRFNNQVDLENSIGNLPYCDEPLGSFYSWEKSNVINAWSSILNAWNKGNIVTITPVGKDALDITRKLYAEIGRLSYASSDEDFKKAIIPLAFTPLYWTAFPGLDGPMFGIHPPCKPGRGLFIDGGNRIAVVTNYDANQIYHYQNGVLTSAYPQVAQPRRRNNSFGDAFLSGFLGGIIGGLTSKRRTPVNNQQYFDAANDNRLRGRQHGGGGMGLTGGTYDTRRVPESAIKPVRTLKDYNQ